MKTLKLVLIGLGYTVIIASHIWMLINGLPESQHIAHAIGNLVAVVLIFAGGVLR